MISHHKYPNCFNLKVKSANWNKLHLPRLYIVTLTRSLPYCAIRNSLWKNRFFETTTASFVSQEVRAGWRRHIFSFCVRVARHLFGVWLVSSRQRRCEILNECVFDLFLYVYYSDYAAPHSLYNSWSHCKIGIIIL